MRWVRDRDRQLTAEIFRARNLALHGIIEDVEQPPVPKDLEQLPPGDLGNSGALVRRVERLMRRAFHEYRDEMSAKVREYEGVARSEGRVHGAVRAWRERDVGLRPPRVKSQRRPPPALRLPEDALELLVKWRERAVPVHGTPTATVDDDRADTRIQPATSLLLRHARDLPRRMPRAAAGWATTDEPTAMAPRRSSVRADRRTL